eukprot:3121945-Amphidinium_carterae.1
MEGLAKPCWHTWQTTKSWRRDAHVKRTYGWNSEWGPSSSCENSEEKYVPCTIKLREAPGFMKRDEEE